MGVSAQGGVCPGGVGVCHGGVCPEGVAVRWVSAQGCVSAREVSA